MVEHPLDRDLDNDGIPDMWIDKGRMVWKSRKYKEIWDKYTNPDPHTGKPRLDNAVILIDVLNELEDMDDTITGALTNINDTLRNIQELLEK